MTLDPSDQVPLGRISGVFGVKGWVKVHSDTAPRQAIVGYRQWQIEQRDQPKRVIDVLEGRLNGKSVVARLEGIDDREQAAELVGATISIERQQLPALPEGEYYWTDLVGLAVVNLDEVSFGKVDHLFATGANDVMSVKGDRERLVPWLQGDVVKHVDLAQGRIVVDWDADF